MSDFQTTGMTIQAQEEPQKTQARISLNGKLTGDTAPLLRTKIADLLEKGYREIDVDMTDLQYIDSIGLAEMVPIYRHITAHQGFLRVTNPRRLIRRVLCTASLDSLFEIGPEQDKS